MPNVIMEAIVSGLPVIASNSTAANKDLVNEKNGTGILVKLNDKIELEKAILKIINQKEKMDFMNADLIKKFSIENYGKEMDKIYHELISQ
jgi:glycosyltransferase involved in cell wall biosynthesis